VNRQRRGNRTCYGDPVATRRGFLTSTLGLAAVAAGCRGLPPSGGAAASGEVGAVGTSGRDEWSDVRAAFDLSDEYVHMSALLISSHPQPVREAIDRYRRELDRNPVPYLTEHNRRLQAEACAAAARYMAVDAGEIALTDSTTMGLGLLYCGLRLRPGQQILTTSSDYYATHESLRLASLRGGAIVREIPLYEPGEPVSADELVGRITSAIVPATRALALTWVHSSTGLKLPVTRLSGALARVNESRDEGDQVLLCLDGVHGFGIEDTTVTDLGVDFFAAGTHKWLFGPRGTGVLWGRKDLLDAVIPTIPSFVDSAVWEAWIEDRDPRGPVTATRVTPGGFKAFEHQWAMREAFEFHERIGKARVARRTHDLARHLKEGLAGMPHVRLMTPIDDELSAGIVSFEVDGMKPQAVVQRLRDRRIIASVTPYATPFARLTPSIRNTEEEIELALDAVRSLT
jgi:isopenicillin-N epimerase